KLADAAVRAMTLSTDSPGLRPSPSTCKECSRAYSPSITNTAIASKEMVGLRATINDSRTSVSSRCPLAAFATSSMSCALDSRRSIVDICLEYHGHAGQGLRGLHFLRLAISHRRSPICNIPLHYALKIREMYCKRMLQIGGWRWLIADFRS